MSITTRRYDTNVAVDEGISTYNITLYNFESKSSQFFESISRTTTSSFFSIIEGEPYELKYLTYSSNITYLLTIVSHYSII